MTEPRPLLAFPPVEAMDRPTGSSRFVPPPQVPDHGRQTERLGPRFTRLQAAMDARALQVTDETDEVDPELVVVFDIAGSVNRFLTAARHVEELEVLVEQIGEELEADEEFHHLDKHGQRIDKSVATTYYCVATNVVALDELVSLYRRWEADQDVDFPYGQTAWRDVFTQLHDLRRWGPEDRVRETSLREVWAETLDVTGRSLTRIEVELWFRQSAEGRERAQGELNELIEQAGGRVIDTTQYEGISYHGILADIPATEAQRVIDQGPHAIELLNSVHVWTVASATPMAVRLAGEPATETARHPGDQKAEGPPRIALLDGLPVANHHLLQGRLVIDDPDDLEATYDVESRHHGTSMASIILHGDAARASTSLDRPLLVRPILQPRPGDPAEEELLPDRLVVDLVHAAFARLFDGDDPVAPTVKVVNLSVGDPRRMFIRRMSPLGRMLDWLALRYGVVIVVSGGNQPTEEIEVEIGEGSDGVDELRHHLYTNARTRRMYSPAESINAITVGATHDDATDPDLPDTVVDLVRRGDPAPFTPQGTGHGRSIKPDVLAPGGRTLFIRPGEGAASPAVFRRARTAARGPGLLTARGGNDPAALHHVAGTSFAAGLASRTLSRILEHLEQLKPSEGLPPPPDARFHAVLAKALLTHTASWGPAGARVGDQLDLTRRSLVPLLGYGVIDPGRAGVADRLRATLVAAGEIGIDRRHTHRFPLPPSLSGTTVLRRLTLTLAWFSPVNPRSQRYRGAKLEASYDHKQVAVAGVNATKPAARRGTLQHEVFEGTRAPAFVAGDDLVVHIDCTEDAGGLDGEQVVPYGLAVSLEAVDSVEQLLPLNVHQEVRDQLRQRVAQRAPVRVRP